jgi:CheY-like chemotaxis protein
MKTRPRLLLVDDDLGAMTYVVMALEQAGYDVTQKSSVAEAIGFLREFSQTIDGVILDVMLPVGSRDSETEGFGREGGHAVFKCLQSEYPGIPILILSNVSSGNLLGNFTISEHVRVERKPDHTPFEIVAIVRSLVGAAHSGDDGRPSTPVVPS